MATPRDRGAVGRESTFAGTRAARPVGDALASAAAMEARVEELVDLSKFKTVIAAAKAATAKSFEFSSDYRDDPMFGYSCSYLWDKPGFSVVEDDAEFGARMNSLVKQLAADEHLDDIPRSKVEATLRATNGHVGRAMQTLCVHAARACSSRKHSPFPSDLV